jgi:hypothetical protein
MWPPRSPNLNPPVGTPKSLVYAAPVDNVEALHHRTVDTCQTIVTHPASLQGCGGPSSISYYNYTLSAIYRKLNVSGHVLIWICLLLCGTRAQNLSAPFSYTLYCGRIVAHPSHTHTHTHTHTLYLHVVPEVDTAH